MARLLLLALAAAAAHAQPGLEVTVLEEPYGTPLDGVRVVATGILPGYFRTMQPLVCETGAAGRCTFNAVPSSSWQVRISKPGYLDAEDPLSRIITERIAVSKEGARLRVGLIKGALLEGAVYTGAGKPVRGALLRLRRIVSEESSTPLLLTAKTGADGRFLLDEIPPGKYGMWIAPPEDVRLDSLRRDPESGETTGYAVRIYHTGVEEMHWVEPVETWAGAQLRNRVVVLRPARVYSLRGRLIDQSTGEPLGAAQVALRTADEIHEDVFRPRDVHPARGTFEFEGLARGDYELLVTRRGLTPALPMAVKVEVRGELEDVRDFVVPEWVSLPGRVVRPAARRMMFMAGARTLVNVAAVTGAAGELTAAPDPDGRFEVRYLPPGTYKVSVEPEELHSLERVLLGQRDVTTEPFEVTGGMEVGLFVHLAPGGAEVSGRALRGEEEAAPRAQVIFVPEDERKRGRRDLVYTGRADESGEWSLGPVAPGVYRVFCFERRSTLDPHGPEFWKKHAPQGTRVNIPTGGVVRFDLRAARNSGGTGD